jgi:hypothetical protein
MSTVVWAISPAAVVGLLLIVAGMVDTAVFRRPPARIGQTARKAPPLLPHGGWRGGGWHPEFLLARGRRVRATRARYRYPEEL